MVGDGYGHINKENFVYNYVDNSYARVLFDYGVIGTIIVIAIYTSVLAKSYKDKNYWLIFAIFGILVLASMEVCLINIDRNIFLIMFIPALQGKKIDDKKKIVNV